MNNSVHMGQPTIFSKVVGLAVPANGVKASVNTGVITQNNQHINNK